MKKEFNVTGTCYPSDHYMADVTKKLDGTLALVESGKYFIINRPRQYGKTTTMFTITDMLRKTGDYIVLTTSFEGVGDLMFTDEKIFAPRFVALLSKAARHGAPDLSKWLKETALQTHDMEGLSDVITDMVSKTDKKFVLMIDFQFKGARQGQILKMTCITFSNDNRYVFAFQSQGVCTR